MDDTGTKASITEDELVQVVQRARVILDGMDQDHSTGFTTREFTLAYGLDPDRTTCIRKSRIVLRHLKEAGIIRSQKVVRKNVHGDEGIIYGWAVV